jgi:hypothetical protein
MPDVADVSNKPGSTNAEVKCPRCRRMLTYVEPVKPESYGQVRPSSIAVPHESHIYDCSEHGHWRLFVSGRIEKVAR